MDQVLQQNLFSVNKETDDDWFSEALSALNISIEGGWPDKFGFGINRVLTESSQPVRVLSLFSGGGGLDIGFHDAGFDIVECNEIEKSFAETLVRNAQEGHRLHGTNVVCQDIRTYTPELENIDFIIGGPPCQTFSAAGARAAGVNGLDDDRGTLFEEYVRILKQLKPKGFLFENVYRIIGAQGGKPWEQIQQAFKSCGYQLYWRIIDAADYGVPQHRERLIIVGLREGHFLFPTPSHGPDSKVERCFYNASFATSHLPEPDVIKEIGGRHGHLLRGIPAGLNYSFYTERMGHPEPIFAWRSKFSDYLYKADPERPVRTIKAQGGQYTGPFHWESRMFTEDELKRLQTFPDDYEVIGKRQKVIHQLGNSVPPQLARVLALAVQDQVFNQKLPFTFEYMPSSQELSFRKRKSRLTKIYAEKAKIAIEMLKAPDRKQVHTTGVIYAALGSNLELKHDTSYFEGATEIDFDIYEGSWKLEANSENSTCFYELGAVQVESVSSEVKEIRLISNCQNLKTVTVLWKTLEYLIKQHAHKDDLIQLFGYYQYSQKFRVSFDIKSSNRADVAAVLLKHMSEGIETQKIIHLNDLSRAYGIEKGILVDGLRYFKQIGFEIRSNNTNKQIPEDHILIPYSFPTLNERSLQRHTEL